MLLVHRPCGGHLSKTYCSWQLTRTVFIDRSYRILPPLAVNTSSLEPSQHKRQAARKPRVGCPKETKELRKSERRKETKKIMKQILCFRALSIVLSLSVYFSKQNVSETRFCLRIQVKPTQLGPVDRANSYLRTPVSVPRWGT
jgi:hypothetical protein